MRHKTAPYPGIPALLAQLEQASIGIAVVSNKFDTAVKELCRDYFGPVVPVPAIRRIRLRRRKPAPDTVFAALDELGVPAARAVYVGDSRWTSRPPGTLEWTASPSPGVSGTPPFSLPTGPDVWSELQRSFLIFCSELHPLLLIGGGDIFISISNPLPLSVLVYQFFMHRATFFRARSSGTVCSTCKNLPLSAHTKPTIIKGAFLWSMSAALPAPGSGRQFF